MLVGGRVLLPISGRNPFVLSLVFESARIYYDFSGWDPPTVQADDILQPIPLHTILAHAASDPPPGLSTYCYLMGLENVDPLWLDPEYHTMDEDDHPREGTEVDSCDLAVYVRRRIQETANYAFIVPPKLGQRDLYTKSGYDWRALDIWEWRHRLHSNIFGPKVSFRQYSRAEEEEINTRTQDADIYFRNWPSHEDDVPKPYRLRHRLRRSRVIVSVIRAVTWVEILCEIAVSGW